MMENGYNPSPRHFAKRREPLDYFSTPRRGELSPPSENRESTRLNNNSDASPSTFKESPINSLTNSSLQSSTIDGSSPNLVRMKPKLRQESDEEGCQTPMKTEDALGLLLDIMDGKGFSRVETNISESDWKRIAVDFKERGGMKGVGHIKLKNIYNSYLMECRSPNRSGLDDSSFLQTRNRKKSLNTTFSEEEDTDQPPGHSTYTGMKSCNSTVNNSTVTDISITKEKVSSSSSSSLFSYGIIILLIAVILSGVIHFNNKNNRVPSSEEWARRSKQLRVKMQDMKKLFPSQSSDTIKLAFIAMDTAFQSHPMHPGILTLVSGPAGRSTADCFLDQLILRAGSALDIQTNVDRKQFIVNGSIIAHSAKGKEELSGGVETRMAGPGLAAIAGLEQLTGWQALALHGLADDSTARYKNAVLLMTLEGEPVKEPCEPSGKAEKLLLQYWNDIPLDQLTALISRLTVGVVELVPEDRETIQRICPNL